MIESLMLGLYWLLSAHGALAVGVVLVGRAAAAVAKDAIGKAVSRRAEPTTGMARTTALAYAEMIAAAWLGALLLLRPPPPISAVIAFAAALDVLLSTRRSSWRQAPVLAVGAAILVLVGSNYARHGRSAPRGDTVFNGLSSDLSQTQVVATLETPLEKGKNAIWCASFQAAWKTLQTDLAGGPVALAGDGPLVDSLNQAYVPGPDVPEDSLYTAAGWENQGIVEKITRDLKHQFPDKEAPQFPGIIPGSFVAYSCLEARVPFHLPYFQSVEPLRFTSSDGSETEVSSFGLREKDNDAYYELREQPKVLISTQMDEDGRLQAKPRECVADLDAESEPSQIIVAMVEPKETLADTVALVEEKIASKHYASGIGPNDVLLVPDVVWRITHHFAGLEGREFRNAALRRQRLDVAQQDISFRLDRYGAEVRSEAKMHAMCRTTYYVFDRPFLILLRKRGEQRPYFVMWVDNAELLRPFRAP